MRARTCPRHINFRAAVMFGLTGYLFIALSRRTNRIEAALRVRLSII